jgi:F0F1-type ATP synthase delta subunit
VNNKVSRRVVARAVATKLLHEPTKRSHWIKVTAAYLMEQNMVDDADLFLNDLAHELYTQSGHLFVDVTSAHKLTDTIRSELKRTLKSATGAQHVELAEHTDPSLLGGLIARTPDAQLDASVRTKLKQLASL